jgi:cell division septation protein DedD
LLDVELDSRPYRDKSYTSLLPKIATGVIAVLVVVFVVWWMNLERGEPADPLRNQPTDVAETTPAPVTGDPQGAGQTDPVGESATGTDAAGEQTQPPDSGPAAPDSVVQQPETTAGEQTTEPAPDESGTGEVTEPPLPRINSRNIIVMSDVQNNFAGSYLIHISSFRESAKARNEIEYLEARGFPVFIVFLDLGPKGTWYRVYAGPLDTRDEARNMKKLLDDTPQVRFTRITRVSG